MKEAGVLNRKKEERQRERLPGAKLNKQQCEICKNVLRRLADMQPALETMKQAGINIDNLEEERRRLVQAFSLLAQFMGS